MRSNVLGRRVDTCVGRLLDRAHSQGRGPMLVGMEQMGVPQEFINTLRMDDGSGEHMNMLKVRGPRVSRAAIPIRL